MRGLLLGDQETAMELKATFGAVKALKLPGTSARVYVETTGVTEEGRRLKLRARVKRE